MVPSTVFVASKQLDLKLFVEEYDERPPVASSNRATLDKWVKAKGFYSQDEGADVLLISDRCNIYRQLWVAKTLENYRKPMIDFLKREYDLSANFSDFDADHVIARVRLAEHSEAWINIFPVVSQWNRFFGAIETRKTFRIRDSDFVDGLYFLTGFEALKLFYSNIERLVEHAMESFATKNPTSLSIIGEMNQLTFL